MGLRSNCPRGAAGLFSRVEGFFTPRFPPPFLAPDTAPGALSFYDTGPLRTTLEERGDFDMINQKDVLASGIGIYDMTST
jgi:NTE family protein